MAVSRRCPARPNSFRCPIVSLISILNHGGTESTEEKKNKKRIEKGSGDAQMVPTILLLVAIFAAWTFLLPSDLYFSVSSVPSVVQDLVKRRNHVLVWMAAGDEPRMHEHVEYRLVFVAVDLQVA